MASTRTAARPVAPARAAAPAHQSSLDGLRAAAAGAVLLTHVGSLTGYSTTGTPVSWVLSRGDVGVPVFFTLSGLLLYRKWAAAALTGEKAGPVGVYLRRRALRILPAYWAVVLVALPVFNPGQALHAWPWVQYLLLIQIYDAHPWWSGTGATGLAQTWSLAVEVSFYLVLPLLAAALAWLARRGERGGSEAGTMAGGPPPAVLSRRARRLLAGIAVPAALSFGWAALAFYPREAWWFGGTLPPLMVWFSAGMAIGVAQAWAAAEPDRGGPAGRFCRSVAASAGMCGLIAACAFAIACTPLTGAEFLGIPGLWPVALKTALYALIAAALVAPVAFQPLLPGQGGGLLSARLLGSRVSRFLGKISYGIFLWQFVVAYAFFGVAHLRTAFYGGSYNTAEATLIGLVIAALTVAAATVSYYLIELPAQEFVRRRRAVASEPTGRYRALTAPVGRWRLPAGRRWPGR